MSRAIFQTFKWLAGGAALSLILCGRINAAALTVGATLDPVSGEADPVGGTVIANQTVPFTAVGSGFSGSLISKVISGDTSNTLGGLTFTFELSNTAGTEAINTMTLLDYAGFTTDASYQTPQVISAIIPDKVRRNTASVIGWEWSAAPAGNGVLAVGTASPVLVIQTNAPSFTNTTASIIDGDIATAATYGPIPEPSSLALLALAGFGLVRRR